MDVMERKALVERKRAALAALAKKCEAAKCELCGYSEWEPRGVFELGPSIGPEAQKLLTATVAIIRCKGCGFLRFFDAASTGAIILEPKR